MLKVYRGKLGNEVYDFDVRYVDPHMKEHEEAAKRAKRQVNVLKVYRGKLGNEEAPQPVCRAFLSQLMQLGMLQLEARKFKGAREAFKECMDLDGDGNNAITTARQRLMRLFLEANKPASARRLWEKFPEDRSTWIRYSAALVESGAYIVLKPRQKQKDKMLLKPKLTKSNKLLGTEKAEHIRCFLIIPNSSTSTINRSTFSRRR